MTPYPVTIEAVALEAVRRGYRGLCVSWEPWLAAGCPAYITVPLPSGMAHVVQITPVCFPHDDQVAFDYGAK